MIHTKSNRYMRWSVFLSILSLMSFYSLGHATRNCQDFILQDDMRFFDRSTRQIINWLQKDMPDETFKEVIGNWNNNTAGVKRKVVLYEWPFIAFSGFIFLSVLATSIAGFAILFYKKFTKTEADENSLEHSNKSGSHGYMILLAILSFFLIITDLCLLKSNNNLSEGLPHTRRTLINSIDNLEYFQNNTIQELDHILRDDFDRTISRSLNRFRVLADCSPEGLDSILKKRKVNFVKASERATSALQKTRGLLSRINMTLNELHNLSSGLRSELGKMNLYFKEAKRLCSSSLNIIGGDVCKKFSTGKDDLLPGLSSLQVWSNLSETTSRIDKFLKHLNYSSIEKVLESQKNIERQLCEGRSDKLKELEKFCDGIRIARAFTLDAVKKYSNQLGEKSLIPMKNEVDRALADDGNIGAYERRRWWISFLLIQIMLMASLSIFVSLVLTLVGRYVSRLPANISYMMELKNWLLWLPKRLLLSSAVVQLSMAVVVNLCAGVAFLVVSNVALVCEMSSHYERLDNILDTSKLLQESKLFTKEQKSLKLFKKISECPEDGTLWVMFNLDEKFNINDSVNKLNEIPRIADRVFRDRSVLDEGRQRHLQNFDQILRQWRNIGLGKVNIEELVEQVNNPIFDKSFQKLSKSLLSTYQQNTGKRKENVTRAPFKMFRSLSKQAYVIEENYFKVYSVLSKLLNRHLESFKKSREQAVENFKIMSDLYSNIASDNIEQTAHEIVDRQVVRTVGVIKRFIKDSVRKMRSNVGKCSPVKQAYSQTVCLFCRDLFGTWNSWWILSMMCGFLTILSVILCLLLLKQIN